MGKSRASSVLYRLIEAGQLTRKALLLPLLERALEPGDDAVLFALAEQPGVAEADLANALGIDLAALNDRLTRLSTRDLVGREKAGAVNLTDRGRRICDGLAAHWSGLEEALLEGLGKKERKAFRKLLERFVGRLAD
jgi:DNA-binding MarR family transcriptional regulator